MTGSRWHWSCFYRLLDCNLQIAPSWCRSIRYISYFAQCSTVARRIHPSSSSEEYMIMFWVPGPLFTLTVPGMVLNAASVNKVACCWLMCCNSCCAVVMASLTVLIVLFLFEIDPLFLMMVYVRLHFHFRIRWLNIWSRISFIRGLFEVPMLLLDHLH